MIGGNRIAFFGAVLISIIASLLTLYVGNSGVVYACSCSPQVPPDEALAQSEAVFFGRVVAINSHSEYRYSAIFDVVKSWKGVTENQVVVITDYPGDSCGYGFQLTKEYLVYAYAKNEFDQGADFGTGSCSRTSLISDAQADLVVLGEGEDWTGIQSVGAERIWFDIPFYLIGVFLAVAGVIAGGIIGYRRWRRTAGK